jgi:hypothetical protein
MGTYINIYLRSKVYEFLMKEKERRGKGIGIIINDILEEYIKEKEKIVSSMPVAE